MAPNSPLVLAGLVVLAALVLLLLALFSRPPHRFTWMSLFVTWLLVTLAVIVFYSLP